MLTLYAVKAHFLYMHMTKNIMNVTGRLSLETLNKYVATCYNDIMQVHVKQQSVISRVAIFRMFIFGLFCRLPLQQCHVKNLFKKVKIILSKLEK